MNRSMGKKSHGVLGQKKDCDDEREENSPFLNQGKNRNGVRSAPYCSICGLGEERAIWSGRVGPERKGIHNRQNTGTSPQWRRVVGYRLPMKESTWAVEELTGSSGTEKEELSRMSKEISGDWRDESGGEMLLKRREGMERRYKEPTCPSLKVEI